MTKEYICNLCNKCIFTKSDYDKHKNRKNPCISLEEIEKINSLKNLNNDKQDILRQIFKRCLDILRDNEGLTGEKALRNLSYLLILKLIEYHFGSNINIDDYNYDFSDIIDEQVEKFKEDLLKNVRFSKLTEVKEEDLLISLEKFIKNLNNDKQDILRQIFKRCLDILRDKTRGLTGEKALRNLSYLLILKIN